MHLLPNRDGDFSDHASVANMSLGGGGDADSPLSQAVDNATQIGVVFCLAAGNTPGERTIGAPASSRLGITVGSSEESDTLAWYSSRGPSSPGWDLKPELVAPGSLIRSVAPLFQPAVAHFAARCRRGRARREPRADGGTKTGGGEVGLWTLWIEST